MRRRTRHLHRQPRAADRGAADLRDGPARPLRRRPAGAAEGQGSPERPAPHRRDRPAGPQRAAGGAALHAAQPEELRHRHGRLPAGLVHHEAQSAHQREDGAAARHRRPPSAAAGLDRAGRARADRSPGALAEDAHRHAGRGDVARRRRAWRDVRHDGDRRRPRGARRARPAQDRAGARIGARHQSRDGGGARLHRQADPGQRPRPRRPCWRSRRRSVRTWRRSC